MPGTKHEKPVDQNTVRVLDLNKLVHAHRDVQARRKQDPEARNPYFAKPGAFVREVTVPSERDSVVQDDGVDDEEPGSLSSYLGGVR